MSHFFLNTVRTLNLQTLIRSLDCLIEVLFAFDPSKNWIPMFFERIHKLSFKNIGIYKIIVYNFIHVTGKTPKRIYFIVHNYHYWR